MKGLVRAVCAHWFEAYQTEGGSVNAKPHQFGVDLGIKPGVTNEVDDPPLRLLGRHVELVCQHAEWRERSRRGHFSQVNILWWNPKSWKFHFYCWICLKNWGDVNNIYNLGAPRSKITAEHQIIWVQKLKGSFHLCSHVGKKMFSHK